MRNTQQYLEHIEYTFNAFCKIVFYHVSSKSMKYLLSVRIVRREKLHSCSLQGSNNTFESAKTLLYRSTKNRKSG